MREGEELVEKADDHGVVGQLLQRTRNGTAVMLG